MVYTSNITLTIYQEILVKICTVKVFIIIMTVGSFTEVSAVDLPHIKCSENPIVSKRAHQVCNIMPEVSQATDRIVEIDTNTILGALNKYDRGSAAERITFCAEVQSQRSDPDSTAEINIEKEHASLILMNHYLLVARCEAERDYSCLAMNNILIEQLKLEEKAIELREIYVIFDHKLDQMCPRINFLEV